MLCVFGYKPRKLIKVTFLPNTIENSLYLCASRMLKTTPVCKRQAHVHHVTRSLILLSVWDSTLLVVPNIYSTFSGVPL